MPPPDPGYGDPNAPVGSSEWAKRWRIGFQSLVKHLPKAPESSRKLFELGEQHRAWTMLTNEAGVYYRNFDEFCRDGQPWGLGMEPDKFRAYLAAELGSKAADLATVSPGSQGERTDLDSTSHINCGKSESTGKRKAENLRAILRAPEVVQDLYREGRISQADAAAMGPKSPTPEQAASIAEARQGLESLDRQAKPREFRAQAKQVVASTLGRKAADSPLDILRKAWRKASAAEKDAFMTEVNEAGW